MISRHSSSHIVRPASLFSTSCACLLIALLFISCSSSNTGIPNATATRAPGSPLSTPTAAGTTRIPQATSTVITNLAPTKKPLALPPQNCAIKPPPQQKHVDSLGPNSNVQLLGGGVFWFYGNSTRMFSIWVSRLIKDGP